MTPTSRRTRLPLAACCAALLLLGACGKSASGVVPHEPDSNAVCSLDGMMLAGAPGPKAQIQYAQGEPDFFCDLLELFATLQAGEHKRGVAGLFVQDMGKTSWDRPNGNWIDAKTALYVAGSKKAGSMGPTFGAFSTIGDARAFRHAQGGQILRFDQITPAMLATSGAGMSGMSPGDVDAR